MAHKIIYVTLFSLGLIFLPPAWAENQEKLNLYIGESRVIKIENAIRVHVSRKGIIHLVHHHDNQWQMTALRSGVVAIEIKAPEQQSKTIYVQVRPALTEPRRPRQAAVTDGAICLKSSSVPDVQYEVRTTVEMADSNQATTTGAGLSASLRWTPTVTDQSISFEASPQLLNTKRQIIGDPVITSLPCIDIQVRAGGEDQSDIRSDSNVVTSSWKLHGLSVNMKIIPLSVYKVRIPYQVSLRTPTRKQGSYSLSEAQSSLDLPLNRRQLAAVINLSSSNDETKKSYFFSSIPIIGPIIGGKSDSSSSSKLLVWIQVRRSETLE